MKTTSLFAFCIVSVVSINTLSADDTVPPPWRGGPLSTVAEWDFLTPSSGVADGQSVTPVVGNSGGTPQASAGDGLTWGTFFDGNGGWSGGETGGIMTFTIPNWIDEEPLKLISIQLTYQRGQGEVFVSDITANDPLGIDGIVNTDVDETSIDPPTAALFHRVETWEIRPNPDNEIIFVTIPPGSILGQAVIDTISIPEPSSLVLVALGMACAGAAVWRRRRAIA
jgi:hypothetical protein